MLNFEQYEKNISSTSVDRLARQWGVSADCLRMLGIGFDKFAYTFPMRDSTGAVVGVRTRPIKGGKGAIEGSHNGLFIPQGVTAGNVQMICEGESDTAAALTLGFAAIGRPGSMGCMNLAVQFVSERLNACPCVMGDNDKAGLKGAEAMAEALWDGLVPCRVLYASEEYSDLRNWLQVGGLTSDALAAAVEAIPIRYPEDLVPGFMIIPNSLLRRDLVSKIGSTAYALLCVIASYANKDGECWPTREELAQLLGVNGRTVDRSKQVLVEAGLLSWQRGHTGRANLYRVDFGPCNNSRREYPVRPALSKRNTGVSL